MKHGFLQRIATLSHEFPAYQAERDLPCTMDKAQLKSKSNEKFVMLIDVLLLLWIQTILKNSQVPLSCIKVYHTDIPCQEVGNLKLYAVRCNFLQNIG